MRIYMVGNFTAPWCSEVHWAKTLEKLGHEVTRAQENELPIGWAGGVEGHHMFLWVRTWEGHVQLSDINTIKAMRIPTVNVHLDLFVGISRESSLDIDPRWRTDYVFTADGDPKSQKIFEAHGINHHWLRAGVFDEGCVMFNPNNDPELQGDVIFVGGGKEYAHKEWQYRHDLIEFLETFPGYRKYGHPQRLVREADLNQLYANAKVVVGDSLNVGFHHPNYWSDRVYETVGRGGFLIHPRIEGLEKDFKIDGPANELELVTYEYGDFQKLHELITYYQDHPEQRETVRKNGFERVKKDHTYINRMKEMIDVVFTPHLTDEEQQEIADDINSGRWPYLEPKDDWEKSEDGGYTSPSLNNALNKYMAEHENDPVKINLGCGTDIMDEPNVTWLNVDMMKLEGVDVVHNLINFPYPFEDGEADYIKAVDVLEHLPPYIGEEHGVIKFINECHRILKPGGQLYIQTPGWKAEFLWIDPTHVRGFDIQSMDFFDPTTHFGQTTGFYSNCKFKVRAEELANHNLRFYMEKI